MMVPDDAEDQVLILSVSSTLFYALYILFSRAISSFIYTL